MQQPTLTQLKAFAYDEMAKIEQAQKNLQQINIAIANYVPPKQETIDKANEIIEENKKIIEADNKPETTEEVKKQNVRSKK